MSIIKDIKLKTGTSSDYKIRDICVDGRRITLFYNEVLTDSSSIDNFVLKSLLNLDRNSFRKLDEHLPAINISKIKKNQIYDFVNNGFLIIIYKSIYAVEVKAKLDRGINNIQSELSLSGPKDSFSENYNINLGLIRRRIKTCDLMVKNLNVGFKSKTKVGILYIDDIVDKKIVKRINEVLEKIDIDGIIDSSYLKVTLEGQKSFFPTIMMSERPDKSAMALLEGKVVILVDMSPYALILPSFFIDFFHTTDDYYQKSFNTTFIRIIRFLAFLIAIFTPACYIAVTTRNYDIVPLDLLLMLKAGRTFVPFSAYIEAFFMIVCFEILKESDIRMSNTSGSSISILGGLILGDAAVSAGIVSPIMIIVVAISSIAGLVFSSIELVNALRIYKIILLLLSTLLGIYGVIIGTIYMIYKLLTLKVFGIPYLVPFVPFDKNEINDSFIKKEESVKKRNSFLTNNIVRGRYKWKKLLYLLFWLLHLVLL